MFCRKCGTAVKDTARFCPGCGLNIERKPAPVDKPTCHKCGAFVKENAKFCKSCGAKLTAPTAQPEIKYCGCGAPIKEGTKFCKKCGAPIPAAAPKPDAPRCTCGAELRPGAKFCKKCGAPVSGGYQALNIPVPPDATVTVSDRAGILVCPSCSRGLSPSQRFCPDCGVEAVSTASATQKDAQRTPIKKAGNAARQAAEKVVPKVKAVIPKVKAIIPKVKAFIPIAKTAGKGVLEIESPAASTSGEMRTALDSEQIKVLSSVARSLIRR